jgi:ketosteroid isomerase-like protein
MSEENVEIVRRVYAEWERGNFWTPQFFDPSVHVRWANPIFARGAETQGIEALTRAVQGFLDAYEDMTATAERLIDTADQVVAVEVWRGRGRASGIEMEEPAGSVWTMSGGKATHVVFYGEVSEALEAAGLSE